MAIGREPNPTGFKERNQKIKNTIIMLNASVSDDEIDAFRVELRLFVDHLRAKYSDHPNRSILHAFIGSSKTDVYNHDDFPGDDSIVKFVDYLVKKYLKPENGLVKTHESKEKKPLNILFLESDPGLRKSFGRVLEDEYSSVEGLDNIDFLNDKLLSVNHPVGGVVIGNTPKGITAIEIFRKIRFLSHLRNLPVIIMTDEPDYKTEKEVELSRGAYLIRPVDNNFLISEIERLRAERK